MTLCLLAALTSCRDDLTIGNGVEEPQVEQNSRDMVMLSAGDEQLMQTRAGKISPMPNLVRFAAMMLVRAGESQDYKYGQPVNAYMIVEENNAGNSLYYQQSYTNPGSNIDSYRNDNDATIFYWQNRLKHAFIGYIDDYHKALKCAQDGEPAYTPKLLSSWLTNPDELTDAQKQNFLLTKNEDGVVTSWQQFERIDLSTNGKGSMEEQPDPLIAYKEQAPQGSNPETNRVYLTFRHQLSQIQVNLKGSETSANILAEQILNVEMLGVSEYACVYPYPEYGFTTREVSPAIGEDPEAEDYVPAVYEDVWGIVRQGEDEPKLLRTATGGYVDLTKYTEEQLTDNPFGTSFDMFEMGEATTGYLKSFEAIAFGRLEALRITWKERDDEGGVEHVVTFKIPEDKDEFRNLESGKRYIYNLELRRGTLAVIRAVIDDWIPYTEPEYKADGTIVKTNQ